MVAALGLCAIAATGGALFCLRGPAREPAAPVIVESSQRRLARGKHLYEHVAFCDGCHSLRDYSRFGAPVIISGQGHVFPPELGLPGRIVAPNITPDKETGIGRWTDGEKIRAIRDGVGRDGRALFPMMPYENYRRMSDEDVYALVAYMNSLRPVANPLPPTEVDFPVNMLIRSAPQPAGYVCEPDRTNPLKLGEYLVTLGSCANCHTPHADGQPVPEMHLAGGRIFHLPQGTAISSNITPDRLTGIGAWTRENFVSKFHDYKEYAATGSPKVDRESFTIMPWLAFANLSPEELGAIYEYLKTQPAVSTNVITRAH